MPCLHCGAPPEIANQICVPCAADAALGRTLFAEYRYLHPGETISEGMGDEERDDRTAEWRPARVPGTNVHAHGLVRRRLRLYINGKRYMDKGEVLLVGRDEYLGNAPGAGPTTEVPSDALQHFSRPMYATFPTTGCACPTRKSLAEDGGPTVCTDCGRVWAALEEGQKPDAYYPEGKNPDPTCECKEFRSYPPPSEQVRLERVAAKVDLTVVPELFSPKRKVNPWTPEVQCTNCGQVFTRDAWHARKSLYPDLRLPRADQWRPKQNYFEESRARQGIAIQRALRRYEAAKWARLRERAGRLLGDDVTQGVDGIFDELKELITRRTKVGDVVATHHTDQVIEVVHDELEALGGVFEAHADAARDSRLELLDEELIRLGGERFFQNASADPRQVPISSAMTQLAAMLQAFFDEEVEATPRDVLFGFAALSSDPDWMQEACVRAYDKGDDETKKLAVALRERISFMERDPGFQGQLAEELVQATTLELPPPHSLEGLVEAKDWPSKVWHNLAPGEFIRHGDVWRDTDKQLRPVVSSVGKDVPMPLAFQVMADADPTGAAIHGLTPFMRPMIGAIETVAPDPYAEFTMYQTFAGRAETIPVPPNETTCTVSWPLHTTSSEAEKVLRELYVAVGFEVRSLSFDEKLKLVHLALVGRDGLELAIAVPLPPSQ